MAYFQFSKKIFYIVFVLLCAFGISYVYGERKDLSSRVSMQRPPLVLGAQMTFGFGTPTESPYPEMPYQTPRPKFYVAVAEPDRYCVVHICGPIGSFIKTIGGWVQVYNTKFVETREFFELNLSKNKNVETMVVVSDENGKIVGIYPNKGFNDIIYILGRLPHPQFVDIEKIYGKTEAKKT